MFDVRESWTDERLDDFRGEVSRRFDDVDRRFDKVDAEFRDLRLEMKSGFDGLNQRFDGLQQALLKIAGAMVVTLIAGILGVVATQL